MTTILSAYRNWVGVRPITVTGVLKTAVASSATSFKITTGTGTPTTSMTATILDGPNTESFAVHAWTATTKKVTLTSSTHTAHAHPVGTYVFFEPTSGIGPTGFLPLETYKVPDKIAQIYDTAHVGSMSVQRSVNQGMRTAEWSIGGELYPDTFGFIAGSLFGTDKYTAESTPTPHSHLFTVLNSGNGQPVRQAYYVFDDYNLRVVIGKVTKCSIKFSGAKDTPVKFDATIMARASGVVATATASFSTVKLLPAWRATLTIATAYVRIPLAFTITLTREESENIPTMTGVQTPLDTWVGGLQATVKGTFVKTADTQLTKFLTGTQQKFVLSIAPLAATTTSGTGLTFQSSKANYDTVEPILQGKAYNTEDFSFTAVANATDAGTSGGIAACRFTLHNAIGTGVYL